MKKNVVRLLFALVALLTSANMLAENKLWVQQYSANENGTYEFAVMMDNTSDVAALQFELLLPPEVEIVKYANVDNQYKYVRPNLDRLNVSQKFMCSPRGVNDDKYDVYQVAIFAMRDDSFIGTSGPLAFFTLKTVDGQLPDAIFSKPLDIKLEDIMMSEYDGTAVSCPSEWNGDVTVAPQTTLYTSLSEMVVNPGATFSLPIELTNTSKVQGLQFTLKLPKGFTLGKTFTINPDRVSEQSDVASYPGKKDNEYTLMLVNMTGAYAVRNTGSGLLFTCEVTAPDALDKNDLTIEVSEVVASSDAYTFPGEGFTVSLVDGNNAYAAATAEINALQSALDAAVAEIAKDCPDVKDNFKGEDIQTAINNLKKAVEDAYADGSLTPNYETVMAPVETIKADIDKLVVDAKAAQKKAEDDAAAAAEAKRKADNKAAYEADLTALDELYASYRATVAKIQDEFPKYENVSEELKVRNNLDDAKSEIEKAYKAVADEGNYSYKLDVEGLQASIQKLYDDAKAAAEGAEADRVAQNKKAYDEVIATIDALQKELDETVAAIKKDYAQYEDKDAEAAVQATINALRASADDAFKAVEKEGKFEFTVDPAPVSAEIAKLLSDAKALADAATAEAERVAKNQQAYDAVMDEINAVKAERNEAATKIAEEYDLYDPTAELAAIDAALAAAEKAAADALEAVKDAGEFGYTFDAAAVRAMIQEMLANAEKVGAVEGIEAEVQSGNLIIFTLDGKRHANPVHGEVNIFVRKNGKTSKVMVD